MKRGNINGILIVVLISFVLILLGSLFNLFSLTGKASDCAKVPLKLFKCPEGYSLVPNYNTEGCVYKYQCGKIDCPKIKIPDCKFKESPAPVFGWYKQNYCAIDYECVETPRCNYVPRPPWKCTGDNELIPIYDSEGCVKYYQCSEGFILSKGFTDPYLDEDWEKYGSY